jgi:hypothetical protein
MVLDHLQLLAILSSLVDTIKSPKHSQHILKKPHSPSDRPPTEPSSPITFRTTIISYHASFNHRISHRPGAGSTTLQNINKTRHIGDVANIIPGELHPENECRSNLWSP